MERLINNVNKLHTTQLGVKRISKNLNLSCDVAEWCKNAILSPKTKITKKGKNYYAETGDCVITINSYSFTIITAHAHKNK